MARLPEPPRDTARIIPWAKEMTGTVERELERLQTEKFSFPPGSRYFGRRTTALLTATGTSQATATVLAADLNEFTSGTAGTGAVILPGARPGMQIAGFNIGTAAMGLYPATGERVGTAGTNASVAIGAGTGFQASCVTAAQWRIIRGS